MTYGITTLLQWHNYYEAEAQSFLRQCYLPPNAAEVRRSLLNDHLKAYAQTTLSSRAQVLRNSATWASMVQGTAAAGAIPMGKVVVKSGGALFFASKALKSFGLDGDLEAELFGIALKAKLIETDTEKILKSQLKKELKKAIKSGAKDFWEKEDMADHIKDELIEAFRDEVTAETIEELVHLIPMLGQIWSYSVGYYRGKKRLKKVLDMVTKRAHEVHVEVVIPLICHSLVKDQPPPPPAPYTLSLRSVREVKLKIPSIGSFRAPLILSLFSIAIYIFEPAPVLVSLFWAMVFWCIFSVLYYFRKAILLSTGLVIVVILAVSIWDRAVANYVRDANS